MRSLRTICFPLLLVLGLGAGSRATAAPAEEKPRAAQGAGAAGADDLGEDLEGAAEEELLQRAIVQSAMKTRTTIAEAPAVIHIVTAKDVTDFGYRNLLQSLLFVPGFLDVNAQYDQMPIWLVHGISQGILYMRDGLSLFDSVVNINSTMRRVPIETVKRIEAMTTPGGVLWGANSFLGIANVITKEGSDVNGVELGLGGGHGPGDEMVIRPYVMYGQVLLGGRLDLFAHWSLEWFDGPRYSMPELYLYSPPPRVPGVLSYRHVDGISSSVPTSFYSVFDGKISYRKPHTSRELTLAWQLTFHKMPNLILSAIKKEWRYWDGIHRPLGFLGSPSGTSPGYPALRSSVINYHESYAFLRYKDRFWAERFGLNTRLYYIRFDRNLEPTPIFPATEGVLPGLAFNARAVAHRAGGTADFDLDLTRWLKLLFGGEVFYEWLKDSNVEFVAPLTDNGQFDFSKTSVSCPYYNSDGSGLPHFDPNDPSRTNYVPGCRQPFIFDSDRMVYALFLSAQVKPWRRLMLDGGVRFQHAPAGNAPYDPVVLGSAAAVWNFWREYYLKFNYSMGFRPPVFNNINGNGYAVQYAGNPDIQVERSQAWQVELNTKLVKNKGRIRQWGVRLNYSYTLLDKIIRILQGRYTNSGLRAIHAVELYSDLYLRQGHRLTLSYTYTKMFGDSELDGGILRSVPNHWFTATGAFKIFERRGWQLWTHTTLRFLGSIEDPDRAIVCSTPTSCSSRTSDLAYDRIATTVLWNAGLRLAGRIGQKRVELSADFYNMLDNKWWSQDAFYDLDARTEIQPTPGQRFYFFIKAKTNL